ncbi:MAG: AbrB/MazE/SpoVT family DNA-binding domain-containing protein [Candidatus Levyibacteriota bacterium]
MMNGFSTITQKGQVAVPKAIRDHFNLKPSDKLYFFVEDGKIIIRPTRSIDEMFGSVKTKKVLSKKDYKQIVRDAVVQKFLKKNANNT